MSTIMDKHLNTSNVIHLGSRIAVQEKQYVVLRVYEGIDLIQDA